MKTVGIPLVLTFCLDEASQARLDAWRARYFPAERNYLKAHLTVFHQLPGQQISQISQQLEEFAAEQETISIEFSRLITRQGFVGIAIDSQLIHEARSKLSSMFGTLLRAQDKQGYKPHVTITNLGSPRDAMSCMAEMEKIFLPWEGEVKGLNLYHYRGGPWELERTFAFRASSATDKVQ